MFALPFWYQLILFLALGAIWGSFVAALCSRWLRGESVAGGRSYCDSCQSRLRAVDLVPLLSYVLLRGKCRYCNAPIGKSAIYIELVSGGIGLAALLMLSGGQAAAAAIFGWLLLPLAILDYRKLWLPDRLVLILFIVGIFMGALLAEDLSRLDRVLGAVFGFLLLESVRRLFRIVRQQDGMGAGDPKLFGAIGIWLGWQALPITLLLACVVGFACIALNKVRFNHSDVQLPFGAFLCVAAFGQCLFV